MTLPVFHLWPFFIFFYICLLLVTDPWPIPLSLPSYFTEIVPQTYSCFFIRLYGSCACQVTSPASWAGSVFEVMAQTQRYITITHTFFSMQHFTEVRGPE